MKHILVSDELHTSLRIKAIAEGKTLKDLVNEKLSLNINKNTT